MKTVAVAVSFNFFHEGHREHIEESAKLGDRLVVIVATDESLNMQKGDHNFPLSTRLEIARVVKWLNPENMVVVSVDRDGTVAETLRFICPDIYAKGGDRISSNMPKNELDVCAEIGCEIVYGVGRQLNNSSKLKEHIRGK